MIECQFCDEQFENRKEWRSHLYLTHSKSAYICHFCSLNFYDEQIYLDHYKSEHEEDFQRHKCPYCGNTYKLFTTLQKHIERKHDKCGLIKCEDCGGEFYNQAAFERHVDLKHKGGKMFYNCDKCHRKFTAKESVVLHDRFDHQPDGVAVFRKYIIEHIDIERPELLQDLTQCIDCNLPFSCSLDLFKHFSISHRKKKFYSCCKCNFVVYTKRTGLVSHLFRHHNLSRNHTCAKCIKVRSGLPQTQKNKAPPNNSANKSLRSNINLRNNINFNYKTNLPLRGDFVNATDEQINNLRYNIRRVFHILCTVPTYVLRATNQPRQSRPVYINNFVNKSDQEMVLAINSMNSEECKLEYENFVTERLSMLRKSKQKRIVSNTLISTVNDTTNESSIIVKADHNVTSAEDDSNMTQENSVNLENKDDIIESNRSEATESNNVLIDNDDIDKCSTFSTNENLNCNLEMDTSLLDGDHVNNSEEQCDDIIYEIVCPDIDATVIENIISKNKFDIDNELSQQNGAIDDAKLVLEAPLNVEIKNDDNDVSKQEIVKPVGLKELKIVLDRVDNILQDDDKLKEHEVVFRHSLPYFTECEVASVGTIHDPHSLLNVKDNTTKRNEVEKSGLDKAINRDEGQNSSIAKSDAVNNINQHQAKEHVCEICLVKLPDGAAFLNHIMESCGMNVTQSASDTCLDVSVPHNRNESKVRAKTKGLIHNLSKNRINKSSTKQNNSRKEHAKSVKLYQKCLKCTGKFENKRLLMIHLAEHHKIDVAKLYKCYKCPSVFKLNDKLRQHYKLKHNTEMSTQNENQTSILMSNDSNVSQEIMFTCDLCKSLFPSNELLQSHVKWEHSSMNLYKCVQCGLVLLSVEDLQNHTKSEHTQ